MILPFASAFIGASMSWANTTIPILGTDTVTVTYGSGNSNCPAGQTYQGLITVKSPTGQASFFVGPEPCGTIVHAVYPNQFIGGGSTNIAGMYNATFVGSTSVPGHSFSLADSFVVHSFGVPGPQKIGGGYGGSSISPLAELAGGAGL